MKVALVHEHLAQDGGAERVTEIFLRMFPQAPLYTVVYNADKANQAFRSRDIRTSFIQHLPGGLRHYEWYLTLMPTAVESFDLSEYDLVLSSASAFAKGVITHPRARHVCYLHSPTRYLWTDTHRYIREFHHPRWVRKVLPPFLTYLRMWDTLAAARVDDFIANSRAVEQRIRKYYRRESTVIYPPVDTARFAISPQVGNYYLTGGRLVPYKRFDVAVQAFNRLGLPLKIFGDGPDLKRLQEIAKSNIEFVGRLPDTAMPDLYGQAIAFINPQEEDFGITAVEAMAAGRPVIAYAAGGALETVQPGQSGTFFDEQEWESLADTVIRFKPEQFRPAAVQQWAEQFSLERFTAAIRQHLDQAMALPSPRPLGKNDSFT